MDNEIPELSPEAAVAAATATVKTPKNFNIVEASCPKAPKTPIELSATVKFNFGDNLEDAVAKYGEAAVFDNYRAKAIIVCQSIIRRLLKAGKNKEQIQDIITRTWAPGVTLERIVDPVAAIVANQANATNDEKLAMIHDLQVKLGLIPADVDAEQPAMELPADDIEAELNQM